MSLWSRLAKLEREWEEYKRDLPAARRAGRNLIEATKHNTSAINGLVDVDELQQKQLDILGGENDPGKE